MLNHQVSIGAALLLCKNSKWVDLSKSLSRADNSGANTICQIISIKRYILWHFWHLEKKLTLSFSKYLS